MSIWDKSTKVLKAEFAKPDFMDPVLVDNLIQVREHLNRPMTFTQSVSGTVYHPNGDAVGLFSDSHSTFSLHQYHCDHSRSHEIRSTVKGDQFLGKAQDWDCKDQTSLELFETYLDIERLNLFSGIGLYPDWHRKGFHTDIRDKNHGSYGARWFRFNGDYFPLTWANYKMVLETGTNRF